jgi:uncharacterized protein (UPF0332 family)
MTGKLTDTERLHISKGYAKILNQFRLGVHIFTTSGLSIDDLAQAACKDRLKFAEQTLACARWALNAPKPQFRVVLARSYYAMYHAARAVIFFHHGGDDHEAHAELPKHIPDDFPNRAHWENELKNARLERNKADYDPYPRTDRAFAATAKVTFQTAHQFLPVAKRYLVRKGCKL